MKSKVYCTAPWNGITVRENGDVKTCCMGATVLGNLKHDKVENILTSQRLTDIQNSLAAGDAKISNCQSCLNMEARTGLSAIRQHYLRFYPDTDKGFQIRNLDIRWNNSCNLGCVYCSPMFSSTWEDRLGIKPARPVKDYQDDLEQFILNRAVQVREITLVGGEPMLMKQNAKLFSKLPDDTRISIITNLAYDIENLPYVDSLLNRPKHNIIWNISLENVDAQFEYVRNGAKWSLIERNLGYLIKHWPETVSVVMVYSMFSAFDLDRTLSRLRSLGINKYTLQTYYGKPAMNVFLMPHTIKEAAYEELNKTIDSHNQAIDPQDQEFFRIINVEDIQNKLLSFGQTTINRQDFYDQTAWYDQWNDRAFRDLWPHVIKLIDKHLS